PRPFLGLLFYAAIIFSLAVRTYRPHWRPRVWRDVTLAATFFGFIESGFLTFLQAFEIRAFCFWCLMSAASATVLFVLSFFEGQERLGDSLVVRELKVFFFSFLAFGVVSAFALPSMLSKTETNTGGNAQSAEEQLADLPAPTYLEGPAISSVTIIEFLDVECSACRVYFPIMKRIRDDFKDKIRYGVRIFILPESHANAKGAGIASFCAAKQNKYYEFVDAALVNQNALKREDLVRYAQALKLDIPAFNTCLDDPTVSDEVVKQRTEWEAWGIQQTPSIFINGESFSDLPTYDQFKGEIEKRLK
ncbi:MAG: thioredoxin domain-containing protein, partial [Alphaproteobacteria bacterium]|nr:thioredoxin domain-containing protein [Alphaproteobacteria bacterium]